MSIRVSGPSLIELPIRSVTRLVGGNEYERRWWGLAASVMAFVPPGVPTENTFDQQPGSAVGIRTATYAGKPNEDEEQAVETMTVRFNDVTFPIAQNPSFIDISEDRIKALNDGGAAGAEPEPEYAACIQREITSYRAKLPVVTWNRTVSVNYGAALDLAGVGAIWTTGDVVDEVGDTVLFDIPTENVGIRDETTGDGYHLGWLKDCTLDYTGDGKILMSITFEYGLWRASLYPLNA